MKILMADFEGYDGLNVHVISDAINLALKRAGKTDDDIIKIDRLGSSQNYLHIYVKDRPSEKYDQLKNLPNTRIQHDERGEKIIVKAGDLFDLIDPNILQTKE